MASTDIAFGNGLIGIEVGVIEEKGFCFLSNLKEKHEIGKSFEEKNEPVVVLGFENIQSLDVLILLLDNVRKNMLRTKLSPELRMGA